MSQSENSREIDQPESSSLQVECSQSELIPEEEMKQESIAEMPAIPAGPSTPIRTRVRSRNTPATPRKKARKLYTPSVILDKIDAHGDEDLGGYLAEQIGVMEKELDKTGYWKKMSIQDKSDFWLAATRIVIKTCNLNYELTQLMVSDEEEEDDTESSGDEAKEVDVLTEICEIDE